MTTMARISRIVVGTAAALALSSPVAASAQAVGDYPGGPPPQVLGETLGREAEEPAQVLSESISRASRGSDALPVTGGDVAGLVAIGLGAVTAGTVLVRRSRTRVG